jgi:hypothetical protein
MAECYLTDTEGATGHWSSFPGEMRSPVRSTAVIPGLDARLHKEKPAERIPSRGEA